MNNYPLIEVPTLVTNEKIEDCISLKNEQKLIFETKAIGQPDNQELTLKPFFNIHHERYTIYWNIMNKKQYQQFGEEEKRRRAREQNIIVDEITPNEQQPEVDHNMKVKNSYSGYSNAVHSGWRDARNEGYFSYEMKVDPYKDMYLFVTYNKSDYTIEMDGIKMKREFTISIDGQHIATEHFNHKDTAELYSKSYRIPRDIVKDKQNVVVKFQANKDKVAGGVYRLRILNESSLS
ncbi:DUF6805 domain-containing protein [Gracilibacillus boraciitolerans]|uniref:DUF6805 domain-containing protein n=1 Tax=Gracilibacillus boraciitolerans TaxID=307521 RepID=UPI0026B49D5B